MKKKEPHELRGVQLFKRFSTKLVLFSAKFGSLNMQIRNNFQNVILIGYTGCTICKSYVNSIVISCSTSQKGEKEHLGKYLICAVLSQFKICCSLHVFFCQICTPSVSEFTINGFFQVWFEAHTWWQLMCLYQENGFPKIL